MPEVTGPIPSTATSHPFGGAAYQLVPENLASVGYVEEEYFVSGKANVYEWPVAGPAQVRTPDAPYTTRMLVRRNRHLGAALAVWDCAFAPEAGSGSSGSSRAGESMTLGRPMASRSSARRVW